MGPEQLPAPEASAGRIREAADEILRRREFQPPRRSLLRRAWDRVMETLADILDTMTSTTGASVVAWALLVAAVVVLVLLARRFGRTMTANPVRTEAVVSARRRSSAEWRAEAERSEAAGEWRAALRCRYRALVADLAVRGVVDEVPGRTTGDYRRQVGAALPEAVADFSGASELFERAWYGDAVTGPAENERLRQLADRVLTGSRP